VSGGWTWRPTPRVLRKNCWSRGFIGSSEIC